MLLFALSFPLLISLLQISVDRRELAVFRFSHCVYRDIIGCNDFMCFDFCRNPQETYQIYLHSKQLKQTDYEKNYPFPQETPTCPF